MEALKTGADALFILLGAIMVLAMHAGFAFLELGTVRKKNQVNALVKILCDFSVSTIAYFFIGYTIAYGVELLRRRGDARAEERLRAGQVLLPAHLRRRDPGDRLRRHRGARPLLSAARRHVRCSSASSIRSSKAIAWNQAFGVQAWIKGAFGEEFHDFAGSVVVHAVGGWVGAGGGAAARRAHRALRARTAASSAHPPSSIPFLALGAWMLSVGWFGFNVMSRADDRQDLAGSSRVNSLMAMAGGTLAALVVGRNDPGFVHNGPLAGLVAICAGSDVMHPIGALVTGARRRRALRVAVHAHAEPLEASTTCSACGRCTACAARGAGSPAASSARRRSAGWAASRSCAQLVGTLLGIVVALVGGAIVYGALKAIVGLRLDPEEEFNGADLAIHKISATADR